MHANGGDVAGCILALHALLGCDTFSAISGLGKTKCVSKAAKHPKCAGWLQLFCAPLDGDTDTFKTKLVADATKALLFTYNEKMKEGASPPASKSPSAPSI